MEETKRSKIQLAHIRYDTDKNRFEQTVREHSIHVATYAAEKLRGTGFSYCAYLAGLLHDMGKCCKNYQDYLEAACAGQAVKKGSVVHTFQGCIYILEKYHRSSNPHRQITAEILASVIGGHHGLYDCLSVDGNDNGFQKRLERDRRELHYDEVLEHFFHEVTTEDEIENLFDEATREIKSRFPTLSTMKEWFCFSFVVRLIQSGVIAADHEDTRLFMSGESRRAPAPHDWSADIGFFEEAIAAFSADTALNLVRKSISDQCKKAAIERPPGIYRLSVGTGGGKTLSTQRFAIHHANKYGKRRVIYVVPYLSILDQNAKVVRGYTPTGTYVLEHHSNVVVEDKTSDELMVYDLLRETWDSPVIITTMVQLLEVLFAHQTSRIARMQALVDSIIVVDEIQSLPVKTTAMFSTALTCLQKYCGATVVLSSATQPSLDAIQGWELEYAEQADIVSLTPAQQKVFHRTNIHSQEDPYGKSETEFLEEVMDKLTGSPSTLVICNTKGVARRLFHRLRERRNPEWDVYHLSTAMCQKHRVDVLNELQEKLLQVQQQQTNRKVICVSTQLVEAGIDFSFKTVIRALAGLDNIVQAAGRCNRSNEYGEKGEVYLVKLAEENLSMLREIRDGKECTEGILKSKPEFLTDQKVIARYFENFYKQSRDATKYPVKFDGGQTYPLAELLGNKLANVYKRSSAAQGYFLKQPFRAVAQQFNVFDHHTYDVVVPYGDEGKALTEELLAWNDDYDFVGLNAMLSAAKQYTVNIFEYQLKALDEAGMLMRCLKDRVYLLSDQAYDSGEGVLTDAQHTVDDYIL